MPYFTSKYQKRVILSAAKDLAELYNQPLARSFAALRMTLGLVQIHVFCSQGRECHFGIDGRLLCVLAPLNDTLLVAFCVLGKRFMEEYYSYQRIVNPKFGRTHI